MGIGLSWLFGSTAANRGSGKLVSCDFPLQAVKAQHHADQLKMSWLLKPLELLYDAVRGLRMSWGCCLSGLGVLVLVPDAPLNSWHKHGGKTSTPSWNVTLSMVRYWYLMSRMHLQVRCSSACLEGS